MNLQLPDLKTERQWRAATGYGQVRFEKLLVQFTASHLNPYGCPVAARQAGLEITPSLPSERELLHVTLFSLKSGPPYTLKGTSGLPGLVCGVDASNAKRNLALGLGVLKNALKESNCLPRRGFKGAEGFGKHLKNENILIFDGTGQGTQGPGDDKARKENYSGKKRAVP